MSGNRSNEDRVVDGPRERALEDRVTQLGKAAIELFGTPSHRAVDDPERNVKRAGGKAVEPPEPIDMQRSRNWAITADFSAGYGHSPGGSLLGSPEAVKEALKGGPGAGVGAAIFELVNRETGRAHTLNLISLDVGIDIFPIDLSTGPPSYTKFRTDRPVNFADFDGVGARITSANAIVGSIVYLTLWEDKAYFSPRLAYVRMGGWGLSTFGGSFGHGVTTVEYGSGERSGLVPLVLNIQPPDPPRDPRLVSIRTAAMESPRVNVPNEFLFDFDSTALRPDAIEPLRYLADLLNNRLRKPVDIEGHTDSTGSSEYNLELSRRRAETVKRRFIGQNVYGAENFKVHAYGETRPIAANTNPDGSDNPEGRAENRRVTVRAAWNF